MDSATIVTAKMRVVVVVSTCSPRVTISRARRNIVVVLPPPATSATTSSTSTPSASVNVIVPGTPRGGDLAHERVETVTSSSSARGAHALIREVSYLGASDCS